MEIQKKSLTRYLVPYSAMGYSMGFNKQFDTIIKYFYYIIYINSAF